jgi:hypothetical protein
MALLLQVRAGHYSAWRHQRSGYQQQALMKNLFSQEMNWQMLAKNTLSIFAYNKNQAALDECLAGILNDLRFYCYE